MYKASQLAFRRSARIRRWLHRQFYQYLATLDREGKVRLMNYGYANLDGEKPIPLDPTDEPDRLCLQLYHQVASAIDLAGLDVLEVGSGRGGGASYVKRYLGPRSVTGVDYSDRAVAFCQRFHAVDGLRYVHGDAENLPFEDGTFDAAINVESSHCYGEMARFVREVYRVLRPGGHLLWTDHRPQEQIPGVFEDFRGAGFEVAKEETISQNVLAAMNRQGERNKALIDQGVPRIARGIFYNFSGIEGTLIYNRLEGGELVYLHLVLRKQGE